MRSVSGGDQTRILGALDFLELTTDNGTPTRKIAALRDAGDDQAVVKRTWATIVKEAYPAMFNGFDISTATQAMIDERFRDEYGISGDTVRKAVAFFLALVRHAEIPLSPHAKATRTRGGRPAGSRRIPRQRAAETKVNPEPEAPKHGVTRSVNLRTGAGTVSVTVSVDLWDLEGDDRSFVFRLMDDLKDYEKGEAPAIRLPRLPNSGAAES